MRARLLLLIAAAPLVLAACPRGPLRFGPEGEITDPQRLLHLMDGRAERVQTLKSEAKARIKTPQQSGSVDELVAAGRPDLLHLQTLSFFGKPVAILVANGESFALYNDEEGTYYTGPATAANVSRLLPLVLDPREAVMILLGEVPRIPAEQVSLDLDDKERAYLLTLRSGESTQRIWVGTEDYRPLRSERRGAAGGYDLTFDDYQLFGNIVFPVQRRLVAVGPDGKPAGVEIALEYKEGLELNSSLDPALFTLEQPPNSKRVEVGPLGQPLEGGIGAPPSVPSLPPGAVPNDP